MDAHRQWLHDFDVIHRGIERPHAGLGFRVSDAVNAEFDRRCIDFRAVMEEDVVPELKGVCKSIGRHIPGRRGVPHELSVGRDVDQATADVHRHPHHFVAWSRVEIQIGDPITVGYAQGTTTLRFCGERHT